MRLFYASLALAVIFLMSFSFAFSITTPDQTYTIPTTSSRQIDLAIISDTADKISVNMIDTKSWATLLTSQLDLMPKAPQIVSLAITPPLTTQSGLYKVSLLLESIATKELKKVDVFFFVQRREIVDIQKISVTGDLKPLGSANIDLDVKNLKSVTVHDIVASVMVTSPTKVILNSSKTIDRLDPDENMTVILPLLLEKGAEAGDYLVTAGLSYSDNKIEAVQYFSVAPTALMNQDTSEQSSLLGIRKTIAITNYGNVVGNEIITELIPAFDAAFLGGDKPISNYQNTYNWLLTGIAPGQTKSITYTIDYTPFFFFIVAVFVALWLFFTKLKTVRIGKFIMHRKELEEGEEFTVGVEVKNAMGRTMDVQVRDFVPAVFTVKDAQGFKATKSKSTVGTELTWTAKDMKQNEERVFTYKITPIFGIHGTINLPRASAIFEINKKKFENKSFAPAVGLPEPRSDEEKSWLRFFKKK